MKYMNTLCGQNLCIFKVEVVINIATIIIQTFKQLLLTMTEHTV
jgi:hypothetical protein